MDLVALEMQRANVALPSVVSSIEHFCGGGQGGGRGSNGGKEFLTAAEIQSVLRSVGVQLDAEGVLAAVGACTQDSLAGVRPFDFVQRLSLAVPGSASRGGMDGGNRGQPSRGAPVQQQQPPLQQHQPQQPQQPAPAAPPQPRGPPGPLQRGDIQISTALRNFLFEKRSKMKSMFDAADTDADGTVSVVDLRTAWSRCPRSAESALDEEAARRIIWHYNTKEGGGVEGLEYGDFVVFLQEGS